MMSANSDFPLSKSADRDALQLKKIAQLLGVSVEQLRNPNDALDHVAQTRKLLSGWFSLTNKDRAELLAQLENIIARDKVNIRI